MHAEAYGLARSFYEQLPDFKTNNVTTGAFGAGLTAQIVPGWFDVQASGLTGKGIGRYGSGQLPDATFNANGHIVPIQETIALVGGIVQATKDLDIYTYGGMSTKTGRPPAPSVMATRCSSTPAAKQRGRLSPARATRDFWRR